MTDGSSTFGIEAPSARIELHSGQASAPRSLSRNSPHTRHSRLTPRASATSSWSSVLVNGSHRRSPQAPEDAGHLAQDLHVLRVERLECAVLGLEPDAAVALAVEASSRSPRPPTRPRRRAPRRSSPVARVVLAAHDDDVAVEDPGLDHRVALARGGGSRRGGRAAPARRSGPRRSPRRAAVRLRRCCRRAGAAARPRIASAAPSASRRRPTSSSARGFVGSRRSSPARSRFARWACTVDGEASPTASPISRTVGG